MSAQQQPVIASPAAAAAPAPARVNVRRPKVYTAQELFPEFQDHSALPATFNGFAEPGNGVPDRNPHFIQEYLFIAKLAAFMASSWTMITLWGPTGCGKTDRVLDYFSRLNIPVLHDAATEDMRLHHMLGDKVVEDGKIVFRPKKLYKAMQLGYPYLLDEAFRLPPTITSKLHMVRDRGEISVDATGETLKAKPGFKMILTSNQGGFGDATGMHGGDSEQDAAYLNGSAVIQCGYPNAVLEAKIVASALQKFSPRLAGNDAAALDNATKMVGVANKARAVFVGNPNNTTTDRIEVPFSTRTLVMWAEFWARFQNLGLGINPLYAALDFVCLDRACPTTKAAIDAFVQAEFNVDRTTV